MLMALMQFALNKKVMKGKKVLHTGLTIVTSILFLSTIFLYTQNGYYRNINRQLILENDSIISVNIHLKDTLKKGAVSLSINKAETN